MILNAKVVSSLVGFESKLALKVKTEQFQSIYRSEFSVARWCTLEAHPNSVSNMSGCWATIVTVGADAMHTIFATNILSDDTTADCSDGISKCSLGFFRAVTGALATHPLSMLNVCRGRVTIVAVGADAMDFHSVASVLPDDTTTLCSDGGSKCFLSFFRAETGTLKTHSLPFLNVSRCREASMTVGANAMDSFMGANVFSDDTTALGSDGGSKCLLGFLWTTTGTLATHPSSLFNTVGCWITIMAVGANAMDSIMGARVLPDNTAAFCTYGVSKCCLCFFRAVTGALSTHSVSSFDARRRRVAIVAVRAGAMHPVSGTSVLPDNTTAHCGDGVSKCFL